MKKKIIQLFEDIGEGITSVYFVIAVMGLVIMSGCFLSHVLFYRSFPTDMAEWEKVLASWTLGIAWECTLLIAATNRNHLDSEHFVKVFAICSGVLLLFFIDAFNTSLFIDWVVSIQKYFSALLIGFVNYTYSELFYRKWTEHKNTSETSKYEVELINREHTINTLNAKLRQVEIELTEQQLRAARNEGKKLELSNRLNALKTI